MAFFSPYPASNDELEKSDTGYQPREMIAPEDIDLSKPWAGDLPPQPLDGDINPDHFPAQQGWYLVSP